MPQLAVVQAALRCPLCGKHLDPVGDFSESHKHIDWKHNAWPEVVGINCEDTGKIWRVVTPTVEAEVLEGN